MIRLLRLEKAGEIDDYALSKNVLQWQSTGQSWMAASGRGGRRRSPRASSRGRSGQVSGCRLYPESRRWRHCGERTLLVERLSGAHRSRHGGKRTQGPFALARYRPGW